ncbi:MAG: hypothetical protein M0R74_16320 [Dehalococcoidia bacterium]|jgi:hypothetical protein|nr:hypothetical protein [Dehalococcoidia bacterium]
MRQLYLILAAILVAGNAVPEDRTIFVHVPFNNTACLVNTTNYSDAIDLNVFQPLDFKYSLQLSVTNADTNAAGIATVSYELSNNNVDYAGSNIVEGITFTNDAGGKGIYLFDAGKSRYIRFKAVVTETNCWINGWLAIQ